MCIVCYNNLQKIKINKNAIRITNGLILFRCVFVGRISERKTTEYYVESMEENQVVQ